MTPNQRCILIGGGVRSGKSAFAVALAQQRGERRVFVATAQPIDDEMSQRITQHRSDRGQDFLTIEEAIDLPGALARIVDADVVVVDCLTVWLSNLVLRGDDEAAMLAQVDELVTVLKRTSYTSILVTNEVGMGVHPETALGRAFRDVTGRAHQRLAHCANEIYFAALGVILRLRPGPVEVQSI